MHILLIASLLLVWGLAVAAWPHLPATIPQHFDIEGRPDRWAATTWWRWFALPALGTSFGAALGFLLPRWMVALARRNSRWLNVPHKALFRALPVAARERAVLTPVPWLQALVSSLQVLLGYVVFASARVADGRWSALPPVPLFVLLAVMLACVVGLLRASFRAVRSEAARARG
jgi:uncharacterized membrane protein